MTTPRELFPLQPGLYVFIIIIIVVIIVVIIIIIIIIYRLSRIVAF